MINEILSEAKTRMGKSVAVVEDEFIRIRTGRANTGLLEHIMVNYYGELSPISNCATVSVQDARTISVQPWEKNMVPLIEKAILESDLGLNPVTAGENIRVPLPAMTEERRIELTKIVRKEGENGKVAVRNIRRDAISHVKDLTKEKEISEDEEKAALDNIQTLTDEFVAKIDGVVKTKENEVMDV
ncbi:MAG: ribosome recycling factor [Arenicellales bacterium]